MIQNVSAHKPSLWAGYLSIFLLLGIISIRFLGDRLYDFPEAPDWKSLPKDAAIICLTGGKGRVETATSLYAKGVGNSLVIVGAGPKSNISTLSLNQLVRAEFQKMSAERLEKVNVETESRNTLENAFAVDRFLQKYPKVKTIILVTSSYHMRRAKMVIETQSTRKVEIIPYSVEGESVIKENWWQTWLGIELTVWEYAKLLLASFFVPKLKYL